MAKQTINLGTSLNAGDGDPLRTAFDKINDNFDELYARDLGTDPGNIGTNLAPSVNGGSDLGTTPQRWGTVFVRDFIDIGNGSTITVNADGEFVFNKPIISTVAVKNDIVGSIFADDSSIAFNAQTNTFFGKLDGDVTGSVYADNSTILVDGVNGTISAANLTGALPAIDGSALTGVTATTLGGQAASYYLDFANFTNTPTTIAGYGITDAYTQTQVDTAITNATSSLVIPAGSSQSIDVVAADSTLLVDSSNGTLNSSALTKPIKFDDDEKAIFGTGDDLQIWHNGSSSIIQNATGELQLRGNTVRLLNAATTKDYAYFNNNGSVDLYYDGNKKFETTTDGIAVTGRITGLTDPTAAQDAATKAYVDANSGGGGGGSAFTDIGVGADDSTIRSIGEGESFLILGGTGITTASDAEGNITITGFDGAFGSLSGKPTTLAGYGISDAASLNNMAPTGAVDFTGATTIDFNTVTINNLEFADISSKPTTLGGYGITDAATTGTETTFTKDVHFDRGVEEKFQTLTGQSGVVAHNWNDGHVFYHTTPAGDITANFTNVNLTAEYATNVTIIINQGATPYEVTAVQIGGAAQTINWQGGSAPTGNANGIDSFSFTILNDGGTYVVLGQMVDFT